MNAFDRCSGTAGSAIQFGIAGQFFADSTRNDDISLSEFAMKKCGPHDATAPPI
ncbi:MAG: hypothetical protein ABL907_12590 [Hyphomicrobium sp.]